MAPCAALAAEPSLNITSPSGRTIYHPGDTVTVTVDFSPPGAFEVVFVAGTGRIGYSDEKLTAPPFRFTLHIPDRAAPGEYYLTAGGFTSSGRRLLTSPPVSIVIERADSPVSIIVYPTVVDMPLGEKRYLQVSGRFKDQTTADLSLSSRIKYRSSAPEIATVQAQGIVTPIEPGIAKILITYDDLKLEVPVTIRKTNP